MASTVEVYDHTKQLIREFGIDGHTIKVALVNSSYVFSAAHTLWSDASANEVSGTAYVAGGKTLAGVNVAADGTIDATDTAWAAATISGIRRAIMYIQGTVDGKVNPLLFSYLLDDTPADVSVTATTLTIIWNASGILT